jgi:hypothetical protein
MDIPKFTDLELFLLAGWISYILIRLLADSVKLRIFIDFKDRKFKITRLPPTTVAANKVQKLNTKMFGGKATAPTSHIHHFVFGMLLMPITFIALYYRLWFGPVLVGIVMSLIFSEVKELILMNWGA